MKKVKFVQTKKYDICACLDNSLFEDKSDKVTKIIKILELFSNNVKKYEGFVFMNANDKSTIDDLHNLKCSFEFIYTTKYLFNNREEKYKVIFNNEQITEIINFLLKNDLTFDGNGYINNNEIVLSIVVNDHDGSYITFNDQNYEKEKYKQLINNILNQK